MKLLNLIISLVVLALSGCSVLPGMSAHYALQDEIVDGATDVPFTLVRITPSLIDKMSRAEEDARKKVVEIGPIVNPPTAPYRLAAHDVLRIFVYGNPELSPVITTASTAGLASTPSGRVIDEKGDLFFPLVGSVHAAGLTITEFRKLLTQKLNRYIVDPQIDVDVSAFRSQKIFVAGEVKTPGLVAITDMPLRIMDVLGQVGGYTPEADINNLQLTRGKDNISIDLEKMYFSGNTSGNLLLQNGDVLTIPDRQSRKVFILGEFGNASGVNQARSYIMRRGKTSLAEVISDAGGPNPFSSDANKIYVMRADENGDPVIYRLATRDPAALVMADKFTVRPRDVVFATPTDLTEFGRFIAQFFPFTSAVQTVKATPF